AHPAETQVIGVVGLHERAGEVVAAQQQVFQAAVFAVRGAGGVGGRPGHRQDRSGGGAFDHGGAGTVPDPADVLVPGGAVVPDDRGGGRADRGDHVGAGREVDDSAAGGAGRGVRGVDRGGVVGGAVAFRAVRGRFYVEPGAHACDRRDAR